MACGGVKSKCLINYELMPPMTNVIKPKILVVDDTPANLLLIRNLLEKEYQVTTVAGGREALAILGDMDENPDLIILDVIMPEFDGYAVCQAIKFRPQTQSIPVLFLTGAAGSEEEVKGLEVGGDDFLAKPIHGHVLRARVSKCLNTSRKLQNLVDENSSLKQQVQAMDSVLKRLLKSGSIEI